MSSKSYAGGIKIGEHQYRLGDTTFGISSSILADKSVEIPGFVLKKGATIHVKFLNGNTYFSPTLKVNNSDRILIKGSQYWSSGDILGFTYDGNYWYTVGGTVTYYMGSECENELSTASIEEGILTFRNIKEL